MLDLISNPYFILAVVLFIVCVVVGFFADSYFKKSGKFSFLYSTSNKKDSKNNINEESRDLSSMPSNTQEANQIKENSNDYYQAPNNVISDKIDDVLEPIMPEQNVVNNQAFTQNVNEAPMNVFEQSSFNVAPNPMSNNNLGAQSQNSLTQGHGQMNSQPFSQEPFNGQSFPDENINNMF